MLILLLIGGIGAVTLLLYCCIITAHRADERLERWFAHLSDDDTQNKEEIIK